MSQLSNVDPEEVAEKLGVHVVYSDASHLQIDMDQGAAEHVNSKYARTKDILDLLTSQKILSMDTLATTSRSGNVHMYIKLIKPLSHDARCAIQAMLGSDPMKEVIGLFRGSSVLFETKEEYPRVREWLDRGLPPNEADAA